MEQSFLNKKTSFWRDFKISMNVLLSCIAFLIYFHIAINYRRVNFAEVLAVVAIILAVSSPYYLNRKIQIIEEGKKLNKRIVLLNSLVRYLRFLRVYAGDEKDDGFLEERKDAWKIKHYCEFANPETSRFPIDPPIFDYVQIIEILGEDISNTIYTLSRAINNHNAFLSKIEIFKTSLDQENAIDKLYKMWEGLHFYYIGCDKNKMLYFWNKQLRLKLNGMIINTEKERDSFYKKYQRVFCCNLEKLQKLNSTEAS